VKTHVIKPGLLVALKSSVEGGVSYQRRDLDADKIEGSDVARWETTRVIDDPAEHERAIKARGKALSAIRGVCSPTTFGLLCPVDREAELDAAVKVAREIIDAHNADANCTRVKVYVLKGRIASTDEEAARAISQEVKSLVDSMSAGIDKLDPEAIREAAQKAQQMAAMLGDEQIQAVAGAVEAARKAARTIVKRIQKDGEQASIVMMDLQRGAIERARIAFLDLDDAPKVEGEALPAVDLQRFADVEGVH
jgi:hypothetical protein